MTGDNATAYPPEPWSLCGRMHLSVFAVPIAALPARLPPGTRAFTVGGRGLVAAAWVAYEPGSVLCYRELLSTVVVRHHRALLPTVTHIWVDSQASRDGGRELWGIPKDLAELEIAGAGGTARRGGDPIASATVRRMAALPGRLRFRFRVVQELRGAAKRSPVRGSARIRLARIRWRCDRGGPLGFLAGRTPLVSFAIDDFRMRFGAAVTSG